MGALRVFVSTQLGVICVAHVEELVLSAILFVIILRRVTVVLGLVTLGSQRVFKLLTFLLFETKSHFKGIIEHLLSSLLEDL